MFSTISERTVSVGRERDHYGRHTLITLGLLGELGQVHRVLVTHCESLFSASRKMSVLVQCNGDDEKQGPMRR